MQKHTTTRKPPMIERPPLRAHASMEIITPPAIAAPDEYALQRERKRAILVEVISLFRGVELRAFIAALHAAEALHAHEEIGPTEVDRRASLDRAKYDLTHR